MTGWIKLDRCLLDWRYRNKPEYVALWVYILLNANHTAIEWEDIVVERGQMVTSIARLSKETGITPQRVRTILMKLEGEELTSKSTNRYTLISVLNYGKYQDSDVETNKQINKRLTNEQQTINKRLTTNKNDKNYKNVRNIYNMPIYDDSNNKSLDTDELQNILKEMNRA